MSVYVCASVCRTEHQLVGGEKNQRFHVFNWQNAAQVKCTYLATIDILPVGLDLTDIFERFT